MAGFIGRMTGKTDYSDGDGVDLFQVAAVFGLYNAGDVDAPYIKSLWNLTTEQGDELDEILATRPPSATQWSLWSGHLVSTLVAGYSFGQVGWPGYETVAECRTKLGLGNP